MLSSDFYMEAYNGTFGYDRPFYKVPKAFGSLNFVTKIFELVLADYVTRRLIAFELIGPQRLKKSLRPLLLRKSGLAQFPSTALGRDNRHQR